MNKYALIFQGQGSQKSGMGRDLYENSKSAKHVFETANRVLGYDITGMCFEGSDEDLMKTINSQPCIVTFEIAALEALKEKTDLKFECVAGHSLGEYSALYSAGVVDLETVFSLIQKRAELMSMASNEEKGAMAAVIGLDTQKVIDITEKLDNVYVANFNSPSQVVITGGEQEINSSLEKYKIEGAKRVIPLSVSGAFHSPLMNRAGEEFEQFISKFTFNNAKVPVYTNVDAKSEINGDVFKEKLPKQISSSVMWTQTISNMIEQGIMNYIEIGPGKVLAGLNKKINSEINTLNVYDMESLMAVVGEIKERELV